jgi:hypothetical protein
MAPKAAWTRAWSLNSANLWCCVVNSIRYRTRTTPNRLIGVLNHKKCWCLSITARQPSLILLTAPTTCLQGERVRYQIVIKTDIINMLGFLCVEHLFACVFVSVCVLKSFLFFYILKHRYKSPTLHNQPYWNISTNSLHCWINHTETQVQIPYTA